jgi:hypothetical protein
MNSSYNISWIPPVLFSKSPNFLTSRLPSQREAYKKTSPLAKFSIRWGISKAHRDEPADIYRFLHDQPFVSPSEVDEYPSFGSWEQHPPLTGALPSGFIVYRTTQPETELFQPYIRHIPEAEVQTGRAQTTLAAFPSFTDVPDCLIPGLNYRHAGETSILAKSSPTNDARIESASTSDVVEEPGSEPVERELPSLDPSRNCSTLAPGQRHGRAIPVLPPLRFGPPVDFPDFLSFGH